MRLYLTNEPCSMNNIGISPRKPNDATEPAFWIRASEARVLFGKRFQLPYGSGEVVVLDVTVKVIK